MGYQGKQARREICCWQVSKSQTKKQQVQQESRHTYIPEPKEGKMDV